MAAQDPAWAIFAEELREHLQRSQLTSAQLAARLGVPEETVANWRKGRSRPALGQLPAVAEVLEMGSSPDGDGHDPLYLLRRMGMLPAAPEGEALVDAAYRLQKLELKLAEAMERAGALGRREGSATIVRAAVASGKWAVAVWPAVEGPRDCRMHVADRLDIRRTDGRPTSNDEVWADSKMKAALRAAYAVPTTQRRAFRWSSREDDSVARWSISYVGSPTSPRVGVPHPSLTTLCFISLTFESWVNDVASLAATALGYGLTTTRDLAMELHGLDGGSTRASQRRDVHAALLKKPPAKRVWSHHAPLDRHGTLPLPSERHGWRDDVVFVWLREDASLLKTWLAHRDAADCTLSDLLKDRDAVDDGIRQLSDPDQVIRIDVGHQATRTDRWRQVLSCVEVTLSRLRERDQLTADLRMQQQQIAAEDPFVARPLIEWLERRGADGGSRHARGTSVGRPP